MEKFFFKVVQTDTYVKVFEMEGENQQIAFISLQKDLQDGDGLETMSGTFDNTSRLVTLIKKKKGQSIKKALQA